MFNLNKTGILLISNKRGQIMNKYIVEVNGMKCGMCEAHVNDAVRKAFKVKKVNSSKDKWKTEIIAENDITLDDIKNVIQAEGYKVGEIKKEEAVKTFLGWK